jgi:Fe-S-cluster-containing dehydrogenase component/DMSO reductase anchor subunit
VVAPQKDFSLIDELLADQQQLQTPVARFAGAHSVFQQNGPRTPLPALSVQLIPLTAPGPGEQYAFEVSLDSCTGCKACVAACHSLNGLDEHETWRDTGLLVSPEAAHPFTQTITTACHHCADPACLNGCPVLAFEKEPLTGIVRHLDDQCIGCNYCTLMCPYDVPKYNPARGIVRKCDMCHDRLGHGEAPACAQACPTQAIRIVTVNTHSGPPHSIPNAQLTSAFLAAAPDPARTQPTTRYVSKRALPKNLVAADSAVLQPQPSHWPLVVLLTLMPMAVGCSLADKILSLTAPVLTVSGWLAGAAGLSLSVLHLGQPRRAWRVFLGLRKSWLSREAVFFGAWFPLATAYAAIRLGEWPASALLRSTLASGTAALGLAGLFCSVMIYADTHREFWRFTNTAPRFFGSACVLGLSGALVAPGAPHLIGFALAAATGLKLSFEVCALRPLLGADGPTPHPSALKTARLLAGPLRRVFGWRLAAGLLGGVVFPLMIATGALSAAAAGGAFALLLPAELAERYLFFRAVVAPKMPGVGHA